MILDPEELALARTYATERPFEPLSPEQLKRIKDRGRELFRWYREHPRLHILINLAALSGIFLAEYLVLLRLPDLIIPSTGLVAAAVICGALHAWLLYSLGVFSIHEGAAHQTIFPPRGRVDKGHELRREQPLPPVRRGARILQPPSHAAPFEVWDGRRWRVPELCAPASVLAQPAAVRVHVELHGFRDASAAPLHEEPHDLGIGPVSYHLGWAYLMARAYGWLLPTLAFGLVSPHLGFWLERLRQYSEHNLMPLDNNDGSRSFGLGFWAC